MCARSQAHIGTAKTKISSAHAACLYNLWTSRIILEGRLGERREISTYETEYVLFLSGAGNFGSDVTYAPP